VHQPEDSILLGNTREIGNTGLDQWIGLRENLQENSIFNGKIYGYNVITAWWLIPPSKWIITPVFSVNLAPSPVN